MGSKKRIVVGITGASGSLYALQLIKHLVALNQEIHVIMTQAGSKVLKHECPWFKGFPPEVYVHSNTNLFSPLASGSFVTDGMVIVPCSMNTLGLLAGGLGDTLITRAGQVALKENKPLIVVPREMPYNIIHLENMLRLARSGGIILPASPPFYHHPQSIEELVDSVVSRILDHLHIEHSIGKRWEGKWDEQDK